METIEKIMKATETELSRKCSRPRYKVPVLTAEKVSDLLYMAYKQEVEERNRKVSLDEETRKHLQQVAKWLTDENCKPMLLLAGGTGNGKTTMAKAVVRMLLTWKMQAQAYIATGMVGVPNEERKYVESIETRIKVPAYATAQDIAYYAKEERYELDALVARDFLVIDDMGAEPSTLKVYGTATTPVTDLLYKRYEKMMLTIVTTNLTVKEIATTYGERVADRLAEVFDTIGYNTQSYRKL